MAEISYYGHMLDPDLDETNPIQPSQAETQATQADSPSTNHHNTPLPETIGNYRIESLIGQGGMGAVYKAEQDSPRRTVALKVIKAGVASRNLLLRFEIEAQILGKLDHPGIATIYEAGTFDEGQGTQPFFAMEFVEGQLLTDYADSKKLGTRDRLALLAKIADAVQHAHQKGIIHRDLKPGNILVNDKGQIKVLDFGVARATDADIQTATMQTDIGQLIGTIPYMSPEQASGNPDELDTRSDVYALGVIAYELLTSQMPYDLKQKMIHEAVRVIREDEPKTLSSINKTFRGDVEIIVSKALVKEKERRYQSASDLASDIERYLNNEPIEARPPSTWYHLSKFSRRNKALVAGVIAVLIVSIAGALISINFAMGEAEQKRIALDNAEQAREAQQAAETARAEESKRADELQQVADFQSEQLGQIEVEMMGAQLRDSIIEGAPEDARAALNESLASVNFTNIALGTLETNIFIRTIEAIDTQFTDQPLVQAQMLQTTADTLRKIGLLDLATDPQSRALAIRHTELDDDHRDTFTSIDGMGLLLLAQGRLSEAEPYYREALEGRRRVLGDGHPDTLNSINGMGALLQTQGKLTEAEPYYREALDGNRRVLGDDHPHTLTYIGNLGTLLHTQGRLAEAEPYYREALEGRRRVLGDDHPDTLISVNSMGALLQSQGKLTEAETYFRENLEGCRRVLGDDHPNTLNYINNMGGLLRAQGKLSEAEPYYREALEGNRRVLGDDHPSTLSSIGSMGFLLQSQGRLAEAESYYRETLEGQRRVLGDDHPSTLNSLSSMGALLQSQGKLTEAEPYYREALEGRRRVLGDDHPDTLNIINNMGALLINAQGKLTEAEPYFLEALEGRRRVLGDDHPSTLNSINNMGFLLETQGRLTEAEAYNLEALEGSRRVHGDDHPTTFNSLNNMAFLLQDQGKLTEAEPYFREAQEGRRRVLGDDHPSTITSFGNMGALLDQQSRWSESEEIRRLVVDIARRAEPEGGARLGSALVQLGMNLIAQNRHADAQPALAECLEIRQRVLPEGHWLIWNTQSLLGETLAKQSKFIEAEPLLIEAAEQIQPPEAGLFRRDEAIQRVIDLYTEWHAAEPGNGYDTKAAEWGRLLTESD